MYFILMYSDRELISGVQEARDRKVDQREELQRESKRLGWWWVRSLSWLWWWLHRCVHTFKTHQIVHLEYLLWIMCQFERKSYLWSLAFQSAILESNWSTNLHKNYCEVFTSLYFPHTHCLHICTRPPTICPNTLLFALQNTAGFTPPPLRLPKPHHLAHFSFLWISNFLIHSNHHLASLTTAQNQTGVLIL